VAPFGVAPRRGLPIVQTLHDLETVVRKRAGHHRLVARYDETRFPFRLLNDAQYGLRRLVHVPPVPHSVDA